MHRSQQTREKYSQRKTKTVTYFKVKFQNKTKIDSFKEEKERKKDTWLH